MAYYVRVFCTSEKVPTVRTVMKWLRKEAGWEVPLPAEHPRTLDSPAWKAFELTYRPDAEPILVECHRNTGRRSRCSREARGELDSLADLPDSEARRRVADCLSRARFLISCEVADDPGHEEVVHFAAFLDYFVDHCGGLIDIEDEGFYGHSDAPLLGRCVQRTVKHRQKAKSPRPAPRKKSPAPAPARPADEGTFAEILAGLVPYDQGWKGALPKKLGAFFGRRIGIEIETDSTAKGRPPAVNEDERDLAATVLANLPEVLRKAEAAFADHVAGREPLAHERIGGVQVGILRDDFTDRPGSGRWTLVVNRRDVPGYAYHLVFDGLEFVEAWEGD